MGASVVDWLVCVMLFDWCTPLSQLIDSDCIEESLLVTCGTDLTVRIWNLCGTHVGSLLHGPAVVCAVFISPVDVGDGCAW